MLKRQHFQGNTLPYMVGGKLEKLAEIINQEPAAISTINMAALTDYYNLDVIERVLRQVLPERLDIAISLIVSRWEIDVCDCVEKVVMYDPQRRTYIPYIEDLPAKLEEMKQRIIHRRQLEQDLQKEQEALVALHNRTQTNVLPASVVCSTDAPQYSNQDNNGEVQVKYHLADLPVDVQKMVCLDDETYHIFHKILREEIMPLIKSNKKKYANLVRFICNLRRITNRFSDMPQWVELYKNIIPEVMPILNSMKQRQDANNKKNYKYYDDPIKCKSNDCWELHRDGAEIEEILKPVIDRLES